MNGKGKGPEKGRDLDKWRDNYSKIKWTKKKSEKSSTKDS